MRMEKNQNQLWTEEEVTLLKFYYIIKDEKSWKEISNEMKDYTGVERSTTALMSKITKIKDTFTKEDMEHLYKDLVIGVKNTIYSKKFRQFIMKKLSKYYGDPNDIQEDYAESRLRDQRYDYVKTVILDNAEAFDSSSEDEYSDFKLSDYIYSITMWTIGIILVCILIYLGFSYYG